MNLLHAIIFGVVEGITEFLPISSTGHLILTGRLLGLQNSEFLKTFEISIQLGAILAVVAIYWRSLLMNWEILKRVLIAFFPTAVIGFLLYTLIKKYLLSSEPVVLVALAVGGIFLILFELFHRENESAVQSQLEKISYKQSFFIGIFQSLAMVPGVSRSAATIIGGLSLGLTRKTIVEFSFLLAVPTMLAATALDLLKNSSEFSMDQMNFLAVGALASFIVALLSIRFLIRFINRHSFISFGVYRIVIALIFWKLI